MAKGYINLEQVTRVKVYRKAYRSIYYIKKTINTSWFSRVILGRTPTEIEYYQTDWGDKYSGEALEKYMKDYHLYIDQEDKELYYYPHFTFITSAGHSVDHWFKTIEELEADLVEIQRRLPNLVTLND